MAGPGRFAVVRAFYLREICTIVIKFVRPHMRTGHLGPIIDLDGQSFELSRTLHAPSLASQWGDALDDILPECHPDGSTSLQDRNHHRSPDSQSPVVGASTFTGFG